MHPSPTTSMSRLHRARSRPRSGAPSNDDTSRSVLHKIGDDDRHYYLPRIPLEKCALLILFVEGTGRPRVTGAAGDFQPELRFDGRAYSRRWFSARLRHGADLFATNEEGDDALLMR